MKNDQKGQNPLTLREKALQLLKSRPLSPDFKNANEKAQNLILELELHKIELELQNEELRISQEKAKQSAEKYMEYYDFAPFGYFELTQDGEIIEVNFSGALMLGRNRAHLLMSHFGYFVAADSKPVLKQFLIELFCERNKLSCELFLTPYNGTPIIVFLSGKLLYGTQHCMVNVVDITQNKIVQKLMSTNEALAIEIEEKEKWAEELKKAKNKAQENARLRAAFLTNISHEISSPLNGAPNYSDLLNSKNITKKERLRLLEQIEEGHKRLINMTNNLVEISKIESGITGLALSLYNINEQLEYIYTSYKPEVEKKGMHLFLSKELPDKKAFIRSDRKKLYTIFTDLIINAMKYSNSDSIEVGYLEVLKDSQKQLIFFVRDTGIGIRPQISEHIFKRFDKVINELIRNREEAGLELSVARAYVELMGGNMWIESGFNKRSTFYFTLHDNSDLPGMNPEITLIDELKQQDFKKN